MINNNAANIVEPCLEVKFERALIPSYQEGFQQRSPNARIKNKDSEGGYPLQEIRTQLSEDLTAATTDQDIEAVRVRYLGRKGVITLLRKNADFSAMPGDEKKRFGQQFNELKRFAGAPEKYNPRPAAYRYDASGPQQSPRPPAPDFSRPTGTRRNLSISGIYDP